MPVIFVIAIVVLALLLAAIAFYVVIRKLARKETFALFLRLRTRQKVVFFKRLLADRRVPWYGKLVLFATVVYLAIPFDIIPDFIPILGYLDDVAIVLISLALLMKLTPKEVAKELLLEVSGD